MRNQPAHRTTILVLILSLLVSGLNFGQEQPPDFQFQPKTKSVVIKNDGTEYIGTILSRDAREILIDTEDMGQMYIPLHEIRSIRELGEKADYSSGETFATRYFYTTNGLPLQKGEKYAHFSLLGPEIHANVSENFSVGLMTTWLAVPLIGSLKFSFPASENLSFGFGTLAGTALWAGLGNVGGLVYGSTTIGNYRNNFTLSGGYAGGIVEGESGSLPLLSVAFMIQASQNMSVVGDSFIAFSDGNVGSLMIFGLRYSRANDRAFQFGFAGLVSQEGSVPFPIPFFGFFRAF